MPSAAPAKRPCGSCPYRRDVPSGVWHPDEYVKLPLYDLPTGEQPFGAFFCHLDNGHLCAGWVACHDMNESLGLRLCLSHGLISEADYDAALDYTSPMPLWDSGAEAAKHGLAGVAEPDERTIHTIDKLTTRRERKGRRNA